MNTYICRLHSWKTLFVKRIVSRHQKWAARSRDNITKCAVPISLLAESQQWRSRSSNSTASLTQPVPNQNMHTPSSVWQQTSHFIMLNLMNRPLLSLLLNFCLFDIQLTDRVKMCTLFTPQSNQHKRQAQWDRVRSDAPINCQHKCKEGSNCGRL